MSNSHLTACWFTPGLRPPQKLVFVDLADQANERGVCWPAVGTIVMRTGLSERTVQRVIVQLADAGLVEVKKRSGRSTVYTLKPRPQFPDDHPLVRSQAEVEHPRHNDGGATATPRHADANPRHRVTQNPKEPSQNPHHHPPRVPSPARPTGGGEIEKERLVAAQEAAAAGIWWAQHQGKQIASVDELRDHIITRAIRTGLNERDRHHIAAWKDKDKTQSPTRADLERAAKPGETWDQVKIRLRRERG